MFLHLVVAICLCVLAWVLFRWSRVRQYWARHQVPHLAPHPLLGSLTFLMKQNPALWFKSYYENFKSPYVGIWLFWRPAIIVNSFELARRITVTDSDNFRDRFLGSAKKDPLGVNLFMGKDPLWTSIRRRLTAVLTTAKLKAFQNLTTNKSHELVQRIMNDLNKKTEINLRKLFIDFTTDVISITAFGVDSEATLTGQGHMRDVTEGLSTFSLFHGISWCSVFYFPEVADTFGLTFFPKKTMDYFRKIFRIVVAQRGGYEQRITQIKDLVDALLLMKQGAAKDGEEMDEDTLVAQAAIFLLGGFDTTAMALSFAVYELAFSQPHVQVNLYKEIIQAEEKVDKEVDKGLNLSTLSDLTYLNCVIQETLRKYPGMGWLDRVAANDYKLDEQFTIPAGTPVYINSFGMHYDPEYYPEPEKFLPERFLPENKYHNRPFFSFGEGPRHCIGQRLALQNLRFALASIILNYKLFPLPNMPKPSECKLEAKYLFIQPGQVLSVDFVPRNSGTIFRL